MRLAVVASHEGTILWFAKTPTTWRDLTRVSLTTARVGAEVQSVQSGPIVTVPEVGGFHHHYQRAA